MRKWALTTACVFLVAGTAFGAGSIISSFRSPAASPIGMCYQGGYLYHMNHPAGVIYQTTTTGSIIRSITGPASGIGVHFTGSYFWVSTYSPSMIYRLSSSGSILQSFTGPAAGYGITTNGTYLWYSSARSGNMVWQLTTAGSVIRSFAGPGSFNGGLDWDSRGNLWLANWPSSGGGVFRLTTTGSVVESYSGVGRPSGCAWDGSYVWYCDYNGKYVYQMDTVITSVLPESLGRIKSIYR
ncbi:MAG TPA: hypothetical protein VMX79_08765 [bacterium]|nr:hypothetical protein [bacterium]